MSGPPEAADGPVTGRREGTDAFSLATGVSRAIAASTGLDEMLAAVARRVAEALDVWECSLYEYRPETGELVATALWASELTREDQAWLGTIYPVADRPSYEHLLAERTVREHQADDPSTSAADRATMERWGERSVLSVPLVFQDEVDVNTNPKIGSMWMWKGQQAEVETPGTNEKRYLAGSLNWRTGDLILTEGDKGQGRNSALFIRHLEDLRCRLRCYRTIHVICDNAIFHDSRAVREYLAGCGDRIVIHFLPKYSPDLNPIERIWWHLHEEITRNHRCKTMDELLDQVFEWLEHRRPFEVERDAYIHSQAA
jgi:transposase